MEELAPERAAYLTEEFSKGFVRMCGFRVERVLRGYLESRLSVEADHEQQDGLIHAGVMSTMADHSAGYAAFTVLPEEFQVFTVEFKINFLNPALGQGLLCRSRVIKEGLRILVAESEVFDVRGGKEELAAKATVTLTAVHREKMQKKRSPKGEGTDQGNPA